MIFKHRKSIGKVSRGHYRSVGRTYLSRKTSHRQWSSFTQKLGYYLFLAGIILAIILFGVVFKISQNLPNIESISTYIPDETTKIFSVDGVVLADLHEEENRVWIPIEKISPILKQTVIAVEDTDFYHHPGINIKGIFRAAIRNVIAGEMSEGASTITQQLARNLFLSKRKKMERKIAEALLAIQIERKYTKTEILELYLNQVYWGHNAYGIESASQLYFGKSASNLSIAESALLVGLLKGPELYSPFNNLALSKSRQRVVLKRMKDLKLIDAKTMQQAYEEQLALVPRKTHRFRAPYFTSYILEQLKKMYGESEIYTSGMKVYTTLNFELQQVAEETVKRWITEGNKTYYLKGDAVPSLNYTQGAILSIETKTGYIRAMQGGADFNLNQFNRCVQALRQPGSAFKPIVYLAALERGFTPSSIVEDSPVTFGDYTPINYTKTFKGPITLRKALEQSINVVAVKLTNMVGPQYVVNLARRLGLTTPMQPVLSLPLGANEVTMMELTTAYGVLANEGVYIEPTGILSIEDRNGVVLYKHRIKEKRVVDASYVQTLVDMMRGVIDNGTGRAAKMPRPVAGKTGTTSDYKDAWFIGFVPQLVTACWVGNDNNRPMNGVTGGFIPANMWKDYMKVALKNIPQQDFSGSSGLLISSESENGLEITASDNMESTETSLVAEPTEEDLAEGGVTPTLNKQESTESVSTENSEENIKNFFNIQ